MYDPPRNCHSPPEEYVEWATVSPVVYPSADAVSPSSGSGLSQTFTLTYASAAGAGNVTHMHLWIGGHGSQPCYVEYHAPSHSLALFVHGSGWISVPLGDPAGLQNPQCAVHTGTATAVPAGTQWTLGVPLTFDSG